MRTSLLKHLRVHNALANAKLKTLGDVLNFGLNNLLKIKNFGVKSFNEFVNSIGRSLESEQIEGTHIGKAQNIPNEPEEVKKENKNILGLATAQETFEEAILKNADKQVLKTHFDELDFSVRVHNCIKVMGLKTVEDVLRFGFKNLFHKKKNFGKKSLKPQFIKIAPSTYTIKKIFLHMRKNVNLLLISLRNGLTLKGMLFLLFL